MACRNMVFDFTKCYQRREADDLARAYDSFCNIAQKKAVGARDLDAIVAGSTAQVQERYRLVSYVINSGNISRDNNTRRVIAVRIDAIADTRKVFDNQRAIVGEFLFEFI